ncbi:hypothetical protein Mpt1_c10210 [Candidatus Methanoplasma termitum]|uniref:Uncharacterized protein n=1 Tax=Candidatus Methanoplasma termitum TaxID=1577791 RepID=A0A0A7LD07_9ARCH|nr:hypothetical protein [Candidatus Methanoplasma termitum]AIZ56893.1 hypothetical protein Mpt1_c10210 [Candidatus Methanoplasma termitum]
MSTSRSGIERADKDATEGQTGKKKSNRFKAKLYLDSEYIFTEDDRYAPSDPMGRLYSEGRYWTKMRPEDLPEWYVKGRIYRRYGSLSALGVKHLLYVPNYFFDHHMYKYDFLYVSFNEEIKRIEREDGFDYCEGYDYQLTASMITAFVDAAEKYSGYDVTEIRKELKRKEEWFYERNRLKRETAKAQYKCLGEAKEK